MENDAKYYARRAREERLAAEISQHHAVRQRHTEMAEAYDARLRSIAAEEESRQTFHLVSAA